MYKLLSRIFQYYRKLNGVKIKVC